MKISKAEIEALIEASPRTYIPFNQLILSDHHQARTPGPAPGGRPQMSFTELAASIKECGVLQNLIVVKGPRNLHEVCAGGRRLQAIGLLVAAGGLPENYPVPVLVVPADRGLLASLAENTFHVPMHPADEFVAFAKLIGMGKSVEDVAAAFGVTPLVVKRRMRLASVSPGLMAQYRDKKIDLECLMVLASVDDHDRQEQAWAGLDPWNRHPDHLRRILTQGEIESDRSPVARYVTVKAYEKAGGPTRRDLFSDDDRKVYLLDPVLLDQLAVAKLQRKAKQVAAEGWKWVDVRARYVHDEYAKHGEMRKAAREASADEDAERDSLHAQIAEREQRMAALCDQDEGTGTGDGEEEFRRLEGECNELNARIEAITASLSVWPPDLMAQAGCVVYVGNDAAPAVHCGLIRPEDRSEMAQLAQAARGGAAGEGGGALVSLPAARTRPVHSDRLTRNLTAHRVAAMQAELLRRPDVAVAAVTAQLAAKLLIDGHRHPGSGCDPLALSASDSHAALRQDAEDMQACAAWQSLHAERQHWQALLPPRADAVLPWVLQLDAAAISRLFTFLVALTVTGVHSAEPKTPRTDGLALALGLDMRKWWTATAASYFNHVSKSRIAEVVKEAAGAQAAAALQALKKEAAANGAEQAVAATGWLPPVLRLRSPDGAAQADEVAPAAGEGGGDGEHAGPPEPQEDAAGSGAQAGTDAEGPQQEEAHALAQAA
ncbi:ParB domain protein nuclease [Delftia sp. Cs1-4]|uniref:ParB/RepB/Spo0J family partition protein n=1 Tax=Delftia sp. (strain Cs1-4) TaxID=742013 RepID=UPI00020E7E62|nr:ParB N-terminal domain-containing protein [Delftia sp. Cs1-4]AEF88848.1 ParB domain protein nuclease [Delftia sp. Cs1-4]